MRSTAAHPAILRFEQIIAALIPVALLLLILARLVGASIEADTWWHLANGRWMAENGQIILTDPFSYTRPGAAWNHPGYPHEVVLYTVYQRFGALGVELLSAGLIGAAFLIEWRALKTTRRRRLGLITAAVFGSIYYWSARPNTWSLIFTALTLLILDRYARGDRRILWWLPPITVAWVNLHGGFPVGLILTFLSLADHWRSPARVKQILAVLALMGLATLAQPYGLGMYREMILTATRQAERLYIQEWQSPDFHGVTGVLFLTLILASLVVLAHAPRRPAPLFPMLLLSVFLAMALTAVRNFAIFGFVAPYAWLRLLAWEEEAPEQTRRLGPALSGLVLACLLFGSAGLARGVTERLRSPEERDMVPAGAVDYLRQARPAGRLFNGYSWGGYLVWALPQYPVFVDSRSDIYGDEIILPSIRVEAAQPGWQEVLDEWDIGIVLTEADSALSAALPEAGWQRCYADEIALVFTRAPCP